ncbi:MAG: phage scaffolding protein [Clostridia bacterium]|nr:phage scaffolding protein [Clostridia bacterium]
MEWLKELLKNAGVEKADELESKISKELPKYFKPAKEFNDLKEELNVVKGEKKTLEDDKKKIEDEYDNFKKGSISQADYEAKKKEIEENSKSEIAKVRLESKIDLAINNAKAKNVKSVRANLDMDKIKLDGDKLLGFDDQIEALKKSDSYLFEIDKVVNKGVDGASNQRKNDDANITDNDLDNLSDEEYFALQEKNNK